MGRLGRLGIQISWPQILVFKDGAVSVFLNEQEPSLDAHEGDTRSCLQVVKGTRTLRFESS